ncbi:hypothetical protein ACR1PO_19480 [Chryseobacterium sp. RRHN12]|uniref:hypothetical protein n=1 Tax=Chryseobacterium sp. RRHN12 TaxID=3437884 RepID=UPI002FC7C49D
MKNYIVLLCILGGAFTNAQVIIGGGALQTPYTQLELQNTTGRKVLIQPAANDKTTLPKYNAAQPDGYNDDATMEAMLMYDKNASVSKVYDGTTWKQTFIPQGKATTWTRARIEPSSVACLSFLCTSGNLPLSIPNNSNQFSDYLSVFRPSDTFRIRQKGLYRINFNVLFNGGNIGFAGVKVNIAIAVNGEQKAYMSANAAFISANSFSASADTVLFLDVNNDVNFRVNISTPGLSVAAFTFGGTPDSSISLERIL